MVYVGKEFLEACGREGQREDHERSCMKVAAGCTRRVGKHTEQPDG